MKRDDLVRYFRRRQRPKIVVVLFLLLLIFVGLALSMNGTLEKINPRWSGKSMMPVLTGSVMVVGVLIALETMITVPKCPHCGMKFVAYLLHIAIASGRCGYCGKSIEDEDPERGA